MRRTIETVSAGALLLGGVLQAGEIVAYESKWEKPGPAGDEWATENVVQIAPSGKRVFLAGVRKLSGGATLKLDGLPEHKLVRIEHDLILQGAWDGSSGGLGPDRAVIILDGDRTLLDASFDTTGLEDRVQTYPYGARTDKRFESCFGAIEKHTLGYWVYSGGMRNPADAVYRVKMTVPHTGDTMHIRWTSKLVKDDREDQWLGLDRVRVTLLTEETEIGDEEWEKLQADLKGEDSLAASAAFWRIMEIPTRVKALLGGDREAEVARVNKLLGALEADEYKVRLKAAKQLMTLPRRAIPILKAALLVHDEPEPIKQLKEIIAAIESGDVDYPGRFWFEKMRELLEDGP